MINLPPILEEESNGRLSSASRKLQIWCCWRFPDDFSQQRLSDLQLIQTPDKRELENRLSERPVFLSTEQFQTINLNGRLNKVFEQRLKAVLSWGSFK